MKLTLRRLRRISLIINLKTVIISALSVFSTYLCLKYGLQADFPLTLIATSIVFPIVFSISGAYKRRETALAKYAALKAHGKAIYFAVRDWPEVQDEESLEKIKVLLGRLLTACRDLLTQPVAKIRDNEDIVYGVLSDMSGFIKTELRQKGLASGEVSRCNQYLSKILLAFEDVKHIYQYRTPRTLRAFSDFFITTLPVLYGPYFAHIATDFSPQFVYFMPVLFSVMFVALDNIQNHLENPFDQIGEDDVSINAEEFVDRLK
ncbi:MAG: hypothetical protein R3E13_09875 [Alphaproteobacteria bacterium]